MNENQKDSPLSIEDDIDLQIGAMERLVEYAESIRVIIDELGPTCPYCYTPTESVCCGEMHHEPGYLTEDGEIVLESEL